MLTRLSHRSRKPASRKTHRTGRQTNRKPFARKIFFEQLENRLLLAAVPTIQIDDVQQAEGDSGTFSSFVFTVTRSGKTNQPSTINYVTAPGTATEGDDYQATSGTLTFSAGEKTKTLTVSVIGDGTEEPDETFFVDLTIIDNGKFGDSRGVGTIQNDDTGPALPTLSINDVQLAEGDSGATAFVFTVTRSGDTTGTSLVDYQTANGTATAGSDYTAITTTMLNFAATETSKTITVQVDSDTTIEPDETFVVNLSNPTDATIADGIGEGTILDDDAVSTISFPNFSDPSSLTLVGSAAAPVGANNVLRLNPQLTSQLGAGWYTTPQIVSVGFETVFDYQVISGGSDGFAFVIQNDRVNTLGGGGGGLGYNNVPNSLAIEFDTFQNGENLNNHVGVHTMGVDPNSAHESASLGTVTPGFDINDGNAHQVKVVYQVGTMSIFLDDLTNPALTVAVDLAETLDLDIGRAWLGFTGVSGGAAQSHDILSWEFTLLEDPGTMVGVSDVEVFEGDSGTTQFVFTASRVGDTSRTSSVDFTTTDGTANAGTDYVATSGTLQFLAGEISKTITVEVNGDNSIEPDET